MSQRTAGLIGGVVVLTSLCAVQVLRLAEYEDRTRAVIEGAICGGVLLLALVSVVVGPSLYLRRRRKRVSALQPRRDLLLIGEYRTTEADTLMRIGLFIDTVQLSLQPIEGVFVPRRVDLNEVRDVSVGQMDSPIAWATNLDIELREGQSLSITLDGWRFRSRKRLFGEARAAAERIRIAAGLKLAP